jgi:hypothetical protein
MFEHWKGHVAIFCFMVFNATFNNIWVISWRSVLLVEETGGLEKTTTGYNNMLYILQIWNNYKSCTQDSENINDRCVLKIIKEI